MILLHSNKSIEHGKSFGFSVAERVLKCIYKACTLLLVHILSELFLLIDVHVVALCFLNAK